MVDINPARDIILSAVGTVGSLRNTVATTISSVGGNVDMFLSNLAMAVPAVPAPPAPPAPPAIPGTTAAFALPPLPGFPAPTTGAVVSSRASPRAVSAVGNGLALRVEPQVTRVRMR